MQLLERFSRRPKPAEIQQPIYVPDSTQPEPSLQPQVPYAQNMLGAVRTLVRRSGSLESQEQLKSESEMAAKFLLDECQRGLTLMRRRLEAQGKSWEGTVTGSYSQFDQDGSFGYDKEGVRINEDKYTIFAVYHHRCVDVTEDETTEWDVTPNLDKILGARYLNTKTFGEEKITIEEMVIKFEDNVVREISTTSIPEYHQVRWSNFYARPQGLVRQVQMSFKDL